MPRLQVQLVQLSNVLGIYGTTKDVMPERMSRLHPSAAASFQAAQAALGQRIRVSDMFRTAEQSLQAMQQKAGVQPPGFSLHNYGIAIDVDVDAMLPSFAKDKAKLDAFMQKHGWYCHRRDGKRGMEDWHYNYLGPDGQALLQAADKPTVRTSTSTAAEARIQALYGAGLSLTPPEVQECLAYLKLYGGEIDGKLGPRSQEAIKIFQRAWKLAETGQVDDRTERTLAYVSADLAVAKPEQVG